MLSAKEFNESFSKFGFEKIDKDTEKIISFSQGKDVGVYLEIYKDYFSIDTIHDFMAQKLFYWQHFDDFKEIESLIIKNHILSEQICEKFGLAIYT